jgi:DNA-directed RNA polymerase specialized sigma24 family protein
VDPPLPAPLAATGLTPSSCFAGVNLVSGTATGGDEAAFSDLFTAYGAKLRNFMLRSGADVGISDELAQEALLLVCGKSGRHQSVRGSMRRSSALM